MFHNIMTGSDAVNNYYKDTLEKYAEWMPYGNLINTYGQVEYCLGIALLVKGDVVAINKYCCLDKLIINDDGKVCLTNNYVGGTFWLLDNDWEDSIRKYNDSLLNCYIDSAICGYYIFKEEK